MCEWRVFFRIHALPSIPLPLEDTATGGSTVGAIVSTDYADQSKNGITKHTGAAIDDDKVGRDTHGHAHARTPPATPPHQAHRAGSDVNTTTTANTTHGFPLVPPSLFGKDLEDERSHANTEERTDVYIAHSAAVGVKVRGGKRRRSTSQHRVKDRQRTVLQATPPEDISSGMIDMGDPVEVKLRVKEDTDGYDGWRKYIMAPRDVDSFLTSHGHAPLGLCTEHPHHHSPLPKDVDTPQQQPLQPHAATESPLSLPHPPVKLSVYKRRRLTTVNGVQGEVTQVYVSLVDAVQDAARQSHHTVTSAAMHKAQRTDAPAVHEAWITVSVEGDEARVRATAPRVLQECQAWAKAVGGESVQVMGYPQFVQQCAGHLRQ
eukprot:m.202573 g.202573  ORF g.202573 m.202573 type:complete len:375 (+) comp21810_c0_seq1:65-1189(+)